MIRVFRIIVTAIVVCDFGQSKRLQNVYKPQTYLHLVRKSIYICAKGNKNRECKGVVISSNNPFFVIIRIHIFDNDDDGGVSNLIPPGDKYGVCSTLVPIPVPSLDLPIPSLNRTSFSFNAMTQQQQQHPSRQSLKKFPDPSSLI
jgi:hypothetical protein